MNFDKEAAPSAQRGNAMVYILLGLALLALLTATMMRQGDQESADLSQEEAEILATQVLAYAASTQNAIDQMVMSGSDPGTLTFTLPSDTTAFNTAPHINKVFHPQGGGLNYRLPDPKIFIDRPTPNGGWYLVRYNNVEWTPTTKPDIILTAFNINKSVCEAINKKITGNAVAAPGFMGLASALVGTDNGAGGNNDLTSALCPGCEERPSLCIDNTAGAYSFYTIIVGR